MPLNASSPRYLHVLQNLSLLLTCSLFVPLLTFVTIASGIASPYLHSTGLIARHRQWHIKSSPTFRSRTILVTGVGMSKGLNIARTFYRAGHRVIGADFEPYNIPVSGRFSKALDIFYRVVKPSAAAGGAQAYIRDLIDIVKKERVDLWVSCSGVASAVEDGEAKEAIEKLTGCKCVQFDVAITELLHEKDSFIENTKALGLNVPETYLVVSKQDALEILHPSAPEEQTKMGTKYIMKSIGLDDSVRADMTLLPRSTREKTLAFLTKLNPTPERPFVLQQFISGPEYCTHSISIRGKIKTFTACPSADMLMHYRSLAPSSALFQAMLLYTQKYATAIGPSFTGHFSLDFLVPMEASNTISTREGWMENLYPIECNPRAHTACVLFADRSDEVAEAYLSLLPGHEAQDFASGHPNDREIITPDSLTPGYYWIGHDVVTRLFLPVLSLLRRDIGIAGLVGKWAEFAEHVLFWKDGTYEVWDPWPLWWLYVVYWPGMFVVAIWEGLWWSRCNVSTTKMFRC